MLSHEELVSEVHQLELSHEMVTEELFEIKAKVERIKDWAYHGQVHQYVEDLVRQIFEDKRNEQE
jgi:hypothetical protein